eukprot:Lankesteria_metandrocarpae@DN6735_c0_g1_i1.p1
MCAETGAAYVVDLFDGGRAASSPHAQNLAVQVLLPGAVVQVVSGGTHSLFITEHGHLFAYNHVSNPSRRHQLPPRGMNSQNNYISGVVRPTKVPLSGCGPLIDSAVGLNHFAVLSDIGDVYMWTASSSRPRKVIDASSDPVVSIAASGAVCACLAASGRIMLCTVSCGSSMDSQVPPRLGVPTPLSMYL